MLFKILLYTTSMLFSMGVYAQSFDFLYESTPNTFLADVIELDSSYLFIGGNGVGLNAAPLTLLLTKDGSFIKDSIYHSDQESYYEGIHPYNPNSILVIGRYRGYNVSSQKKFAIAVVDEELNIIGQYFPLMDSSQYYIFKSKLVSDSQLIVVGEKSQSFNKRNAFAMVYNLNSGIHHFLNVADTTTPIDFAADALKIGGKYYVFKSISRSTPSYPNCITYVEVRRFNADFSIDTTVTICNSKTMGNGRHFYYNPTVLKISDSTFMMVARADGNNTIIQPQQLGHLLWDTNFAELSAELYGKFNEYTVQANRSISRYGNLAHIYLGGTDSYKVNPSGFDTVPSQFLLVKTNLQGDTLWTRHYSNGGYNLMQSVKATSDGGALIFGTSYNHKTANGFENDIWIVKVDSNGNYLNSTGIEENNLIDPDHYVFYPNPLKDQLHFRQLNVQRNYFLKIMDVSGRAFLRKEISGDYNIDVSGLASGVYIYHLRDVEGNFASGKLIKN